jgi:aryl-alcohol dehydrogenase-like predicted oxidoreductase
MTILFSIFGFKPATKDETRWSALNSGPAHIKKAVKGSLKRLKVDAINMTL